MGTEVEQLALDTSTGDITPQYVQSGTHTTRLAVREADQGSGIGTPIGYTLDELTDVFDQLGRGTLNATERIELTARAARLVAQLRGQKAKQDSSDIPAGDLNQEDLDYAEYVLVCATFSDDQRKDLAAKGQALPDGSYPIRNVSDLKNAIKAFGRSRNKGSAKRHIIKRARALGQIALIPDNWDGGTSPKTAAAEGPLDAFILLAKEGDLAPRIIQEPGPQTNGVMKIRVPFYIGGAVAESATMPGIRLHFGLDKLDGIVMSGMQRISEGKQPITVYARHAHALAADKLPVGRVVKLERIGGIGYAIEEIAPTQDGRDVQILARNGMLNAVSLRAGADSYSLEPITINGEDAWDVDLTLDGIDFAPDGPAQPTYGVEVLAAEARVVPKNIERREELPPEALTLEGVRQNHPAIVQAIEAPFKDAVSKAEKERDDAKAALVQANEELAKAKDLLSAKEREAYIAELAARFPDPAKAMALIAEACKDIKTKDGIAGVVLPLLFEVLKANPKVPEPAPPVKTIEERFKELFPASGSGQPSLGLESLNGGGQSSKEGVEVVSGLEVPA